LGDGYGVAWNIAKLIRVFLSLAVNDLIFVVFYVFGEVKDGIFPRLQSKLA
jgi:hypothetical protein